MGKGRSSGNMANRRKQLSNSFSTGGGGAHFEAHVQASYVTLMLTGGYASCLPCWPIKKIKLQGKVDGFETDDLVVSVQDPGGQEVRKLLGQVKHGLRIGDDKRFREVIQAAWNDYRNPTVFTKGKDIIAAISDGLSTTELAAAQSVLGEARPLSADDFISRVNRARFHSEKAREVLDLFRTTLQKANDGQSLSDAELHEFLRHFRLLGYDLGREEGVILSLLHSHISQRSDRPPRDVWARIVEFVQNCNQDAHPISMDVIPEDLVEAFQKPAIQSIPAAIASQLAAVPSGLPVHAYSRNLAQAFLLGRWDENSTGDGDIVAELSGEDYTDWIQPLREALEVPGIPLGLRNGLWSTKRSLKTWEPLGKKVFDADLDRFKSVATKVLAEANPAFDLPGNKRFMAAVLGKTPLVSEAVRGGIADSLALLGSHSELFPNCTDSKPAMISAVVVRDILQDANWRTWGSLNVHLPLLAEAAPDAFLSAVESALQRQPCPFCELFAQEGAGLTGSNYMTGLLWALEMLAWDERYLTRVAVLLGELGTIDPGGNWANRPKNSLTTIFLPWLPQTTASAEKRLTALRALAKETPESAWLVLISLLPSQRQVSTGSYKPRWRMEIPEKSDTGIPVKEYWEQISCFAGLALQIAECDVDRLITLVGEMGNLPTDVFNDLLDRLQTDPVIKIPEEDRTRLWSSLVETVAKHRRFSDASWAMQEESVARIDDVAAKLAPKGLHNLYRRLFSAHSFDLYEANEGDDWREQEKKLGELRSNAVRAICNDEGVDGILKFAETVGDAQQVGYTFGGIASAAEDALLLPRVLDVGNVERTDFVSGYVSARCLKAGWDWVDRIVSREWSTDQLGLFFRSLPFCPDTWNRVTATLGANEGVYWRTVLFNPFQIKDEYEVVVDKFMEYGRPNAAIGCLSVALRHGHPLDHDRTTNALLAAVTSEEAPHSMDMHHTIALIKALQESSETNQEALFNVEWAYLAVLDEHWGGRPKLLERRLATDPLFFSEIVRTVYRSRGDEEEPKEPSEQERRIAAHAYQLLDEWRLPPGTAADGTFSPEAFEAWLKEMRETCERTGHLEVAMSQLGRVLIYAPPDPEGLWIHIAIAGALNAKEAEEMRSGFRTGIFNSRGVHCVDPTGKPERDLAEKYKSQADDVESADFFRLANTMRGLSDSYAREAEQVVAEHLAENEQDTGQDEEQRG